MTIKDSNGIIKYMEEYLTAEEAAQILKVNIRHIKRLIQAGKLPATDITVIGNRKHWRIKKSDLENLNR